MSNVRRHCAVFAVALMALLVRTPSADAQSSHAVRVLPPQSSAYAHTLTEWLTIYWACYLGGTCEANDMVGQVKLLPLPEGDCAQVGNKIVCTGEKVITLRPGTPFVLPLATLYGERYSGPTGPTDGETDPWFLDPFGVPGCIPNTGVACLNPTLTINGKQVITQQNMEAFFVPPKVEGQDWPVAWFDPEVFYPEPTGYDSVSAVFFKGIGFVSPPLPVGTHEIHLVEDWTLPPFWDHLVYDNTWIITVTPK